MSSETANWALMAARKASRMGIFLGLDSSTQNLSALAVGTEAGEVVLDDDISQ